MQVFTGNPEEAVVELTLVGINIAKNVFPVHNRCEQSLDMHFGGLSPPQLGGNQDVLFQALG